MVKLLIYAKTRSAVDGKAAHRAGEVIHAALDTHVWGRKETKPDFVQLDVTDVPTDNPARRREARRKTRPLLMPVMRRNLLRADAKLEFKGRRRFRIKPALIQQAIIDQNAQADWHITATEAQVRAAIDRYTDDNVLDRDATTQEFDDAADALEGGSEEI